MVKLKELTKIMLGTAIPGFIIVSTHEISKKGLSDGLLSIIDISIWSLVFVFIFFLCLRAGSALDTVARTRGPGWAHVIFGVLILAITYYLIFSIGDLLLPTAIVNSTECVMVFILSGIAGTMWLYRILAIKFGLCIYKNI